MRERKTECKDIGATRISYWEKLLYPGDWVRDRSSGAVFQISFVDGVNIRRYGFKFYRKRNDKSVDKRETAPIYLKDIDTSKLPHNIGKFKLYRMTENIFYFNSVRLKMKIRTLNEYQMCLRIVGMSGEIDIYKLFPPREILRNVVIDN